MPRLKDVLDALMADFYAARAASDMRAAELHQLYASDETLSQFSIPSFQFGGLELDVPVVLTGIEDTPSLPPETSTPLSNASLADTSLRFLKTEAKTDLKITVSKAEAERYESYVQGHIDAEKISKDTLDKISAQLIEIFQAVINERKTKYPSDRYNAWREPLAKYIDGVFFSAQQLDKTAVAHLGATVALGFGGASEKDNAASGDVTHLKLRIEEHSFRIEKVPTQNEGEFRKVVVRE